jgi:hypothetical protein
MRLNLLRGADRAFSAIVAVFGLFGGDGTLTREEKRQADKLRETNEQLAEIERQRQRDNDRQAWDRERDRGLER